MNLYIHRLYGKYRKTGSGKLASLFDKIIKIPFKRMVCKHLKHDTISLFENQNAFHASLYGNGTLIAFMSGFMTDDRDTVAIPRLAINEEFSFYSPGYLLLDQTLSEIPLKVLDLSRGTERYKFDMGGELYNTSSWIIKQKDR